MTETGAVELLTARATITDLIHRYCRAVDRIDAELGYTIFHEDATADYGEFYNGGGRGAIDAICESHRHCVTHSHQITTVSIAIDGDRAGSEAYHVAAIRMMAEDRLMQVTVWGRYLDRWALRDGRWAIEHRQVLRDLDEIREVTPMSTQPVLRDKTCPSYAFLNPSS